MASGYWSYSMDDICTCKREEKEHKQGIFHFSHNWCFIYCRYLCWSLETSKLRIIDDANASLVKDFI